VTVWALLALGGAAGAVARYAVAAGSIGAQAPLSRGARWRSTSSGRFCWAPCSPV
jgi:hypothetical protein